VVPFDPYHVQELKCQVQPRVFSCLCVLLYYLQAPPFILLFPCLQNYEAAAPNGGKKRMQIASGEEST
jgi:hypothetical protein